MATTNIKQDYVFKVWILTIVSAPIAVVVETMYFLGTNGYTLGIEAIGFILVGVLFGLVLSIPAFLIVHYLYQVLRRKMKNPFVLKGVLWLVGICCILVTLFISYGLDAYDRNDNNEGITFSLIYSLCLTIFIIVCPIISKGATKTNCFNVF